MDNAQSIFKVDLMQDEKGRTFPAVIVDDEKRELLKMLNESGAWHLYQKILEASRQGYIHLAMGMKDPNEIIKTIGIVAGLNFAITQLGAMMVNYKQQQAKHVGDDSKNPPQSQG